MQLCNASIDHYLCMCGVRSSGHAYPVVRLCFSIKLICTKEEAQVFFGGSMSFDSPKIVQAFMHHLHIRICKSTCISIQLGGGGPRGGCSCLTGSKRVLAVSASRPLSACGQSDWLCSPGRYGVKAHWPICRLSAQAQPSLS